MGAFVPTEAFLESVSDPMNLHPVESKDGMDELKQIELEIPELWLYSTRQEATTFKEGTSWVRIGFTLAKLTHELAMSEILEDNKQNSTPRTRISRDCGLRWMTKDMTSRRWPLFSTNSKNLTQTWHQEWTTWKTSSRTEKCKKRTLNLKVQRKKGEKKDKGIKEAVSEDNDGSD